LMISIDKVTISKATTSQVQSGMSWGNTSTKQGLIE